jgi:hypothetical protein
MRRRRVAAALLLPLLALTGCKITNAAASTPSAHPSISMAPSVGPPPPAAMAGGACLLLVFDTINNDLGSTFDTAGSADKGGTYTCVVQAGSDARPNLTLSITATTLTTTDFTATVVPASTKPVTQLGKIGYIKHIAPAGTTGPAIEIGWLSGNERLIIMRYSMASSSTDADATDAEAGMIKLARTVDVTTV